MTRFNVSTSICLTCRIELIEGKSSKCGRAGRTTYVISVISSTRMCQLTKIDKNRVSVELPLDHIGALTVWLSRQHVRSSRHFIWPPGPPVWLSTLPVRVSNIISSAVYTVFLIMCLYYGKRHNFLSYIIQPQPTQLCCKRRLTNRHIHTSQPNLNCTTSAV